MGDESIVGSTEPPPAASAGTREPIYAQVDKKSKKKNKKTVNFAVGESSDRGAEADKSISDVVTTMKDVDGFISPREKLNFEASRDENYTIHPRRNTPYDGANILDHVYPHLSHIAPFYDDIGPSTKPTSPVKFEQGTPHIDPNTKSTSPTKAKQETPHIGPNTKPTSPTKVKQGTPQMNGNLVSPNAMTGSSTLLSREGQKCAVKNMNLQTELPPGVTVNKNQKSLEMHVTKNDVKYSSDTHPGLSLKPSPSNVHENTNVSNHSIWVSAESNTHSFTSSSTHLFQSNTGSKILVNEDAVNRDLSVSDLGVVRSSGPEIGTDNHGVFNSDSLSLVNEIGESASNLNRISESVSNVNGIGYSASIQNGIGYSESNPSGIGYSASNPSGIGDSASNPSGIGDSASNPNGIGYLGSKTTVIGNSMNNAALICNSALDEAVVGISKHDETNPNYAEPREIVLPNSELIETGIGNSELDETIISTVDKTVVGNLDLDEMGIDNSNLDETIISETGLDKKGTGSSELEKIDKGNSLNDAPSPGNEVKKVDAKAGYPMYGSNSAFVGYHVLKMTGAIPANDDTRVNIPSNDAILLPGPSIIRARRTNNMDLSPEPDSRARTLVKTKRDARFRARSGSEGGEVLEFSNLKAPLGPQNSMFYAMKNNMIDKTVRFAHDVDAPFERGPKKSRGWTNVRNMFMATNKPKPKRLEISSPTPITANQLMQSSLSKEQLSKLILPVGTPRTNYKNPGNVRLLGNSSAENKFGALDRKVSWSYESIRFADDGEDEEGVYSSIDVNPQITDSRSGFVSPFSIAGTQAPAHDHLQLPEAPQQEEKSHLQLLSPKTGQDSTGLSVASTSSEGNPTQSPNLNKGLQPDSDRQKTSTSKDGQVLASSNVAARPAVSPTLNNVAKSVESKNTVQQDTKQTSTSLRNKLPETFTAGEQLKQERLQQRSPSSREYPKSPEFGGGSITSSQDSVNDKNQPKVDSNSVGSHETKSSGIHKGTGQTDTKEKVQTPRASLTISEDQLDGLSPQSPEDPSKEPSTSSPAFSSKRKTSPKSGVTQSGKPYSTNQTLTNVKPLHSVKLSPSSKRIPSPLTLPTEQPLVEKQPLPAVHSAPILQAENPVSVTANGEIKDDSVDYSSLAVVKYTGPPKTNSKKQNDRKHSGPSLFFRDSKKSSPLPKQKIKSDKKEKKSSKKLNESTSGSLNEPTYAEVQKPQIKKKSWFGSISRRFGSKSRLQPEKESTKLGSVSPKNTTENNLDSFNSIVEDIEKLDTGGDYTKRTSVHGNISEIVPLKPDRKAVSMGNVHSVKRASKTQTHDLPITPTEIYERRAFESSSSTAKSSSLNTGYRTGPSTSKSSLGQNKSVSSSVLASKSDRFTPKVVGYVLKKGESLDSVLEAQTKGFTVEDKQETLSSESSNRQKTESNSKQYEKLTLKRSKSDRGSHLSSSFDSSSASTRSKKDDLETGVPSKSKTTSSDEQKTPNTGKKLAADVQHNFPLARETPVNILNTPLDPIPNLEGSQSFTEAPPSDMKTEPNSRPDGLMTFRRRLKDDSFETYTSKSSPNDTWERIPMDPDQKTILHKSRSVERPPVVRTHHHVTRSVSEPRFRRDKSVAPKASELIQASKMAPILADHMNKHKQIVCEEAGVQLHFQQNQILANRRLLITDLDDVFNGDQYEGKTLRSSVSLDSSDSTHQSISRKLSSSSQTSGDRVHVQLRPRSISFEGTDIREYPVSHYRPETEKMIAEAKKRQKEEESKKHQMTTRSFDEARPKGSRLGKSTKGKSPDLLIQEAKMGKQDSLPVQRLTSYDVSEQNLKDKTRSNDIPIREDMLVKNPIYQSISEKDYTVEANPSGSIYTHSHGGGRPAISKQDSLASYNSVTHDTLGKGHYVPRYDQDESGARDSNENGFPEYVSRGVRLQQPEHRSVSRATSSVSQNVNGYPESQSVSPHRCNHPDHHRPPPMVPTKPGASHPPPSSRNVVYLQRVTGDGMRVPPLGMVRPRPPAPHHVITQNVLTPYVSVPAYGYPPQCYVPVMQTHQVTQPLLSSSSLNIYQGQLPAPLQHYDTYYQMQYRAHTPYRPLYPPGYGRYRPAESIDEPYVGPYYEQQVFQRNRHVPAKDVKTQAVYNWAHERLAHESPEVQARYRNQPQPIRSGLPAFRPMASRAQNRAHHPVIIEEIDDKLKQISPLAYSTLKGGRTPRQEEDGGLMSEAETASTRRRAHPAPPHSPEAEEEGAMSEAETASTGRGRHLKPRGNLPIVKTHSKTLERPMGVVFLQFRDETKRALLPNEVTTLDTVKALFVRSFPNQLSMDHLEKPAVKMYIKDTDTDLFYQLQDLEDVQDRSVLKIFEGEGEDGSRRPSVASTLDSILRVTEGGWDASDQPEMTEAELEAEFAAEAATHSAGKTHWYESSV